MASFSVSLKMLWTLWICGKNPLYNLVPNFVLWAKTEEGCWWWIKEGARECLKRKIVNYCGSLDHWRKEEYAIQEIPFIPPTEIKDYDIFQKLLVEEWLKFINQRDSIREKINREYDIVTDPRI